MPPSAPSCSTYPVPLLPTENTQPPGTRTGLSEPRSAPHFAQYELWPDDRARDSALAAEVQAILDEAEAVDAAEDQLYGDARGDELPPELRTREGQLARTREAKAALEAKARERTGNQAAVPAPKAQRNFTDPQSRIMLSKPDGWVQGYNVGIAVDETAQVIVATSVTVETTDTRQLPALVDQIKDNTVRSPRRLLADAGYCSDDNLTALEERGIDAYIAVGRDHHGAPVPPPPRGRIPAGLSRRERMGLKLRTKAGRRHYARRKVIVEPIFGQIKEARGFRRRRGLNVRVAHVVTNGAGPPAAVAWGGQGNTRGGAPG
jgi:hypothetical protein